MTSISAASVSGVCPRIPDLGAPNPPFGKTLQRNGVDHNRARERYHLPLLDRNGVRDCRRSSVRGTDMAFTSEARAQRCGSGESGRQRSELVERAPRCHPPTAAVQGSPGSTVYAAGNAALRSFARTWTTDLKERRICVNVLSPGAIRTPSFETLPPHFKSQALARHRSRRRYHSTVPRIGGLQLHHRRRTARRRRPHSGVRRQVHRVQTERTRYCRLSANSRVQ